MMDLVGIVVPALFGLLGAVVGAALARPRGVPRPVALVCSCGDGYGIHNKTTGRCMGTVKRANEWSYSGKPYGWEYVPCPCECYDGPDPILRGVV